MKLTREQVVEMTGLFESIIDEWIEKGVVTVDSNGLIDVSTLPLKIPPEKLKEYGEKVRKNMKKLVDNLRPNPIAEGMDEDLYDYYIINIYYDKD